MRQVSHTIRRPALKNIGVEAESVIGQREDEGESLTKKDGAHERIGGRSLSILNLHPQFRACEYRKIWRLITSIVYSRILTSGNTTIRSSEGNVTFPPFVNYVLTSVGSLCCLLTFSRYRAHVELNSTVVVGWAIASNEDTAIIFLNQVSVPLDHDSMLK